MRIGNKEFIERIRKHEAWLRNEKDGEKIDTRGNFDYNTEISNCIISLSNLKNANFEKAAFYDCVFVRVIFDDVDFSDAVFCGSTFFGCSFDNAMFTNSVFRNCKIIDGCMIKAKFTTTTFRYTIFSDVNLYHAEFKDSSVLEDTKIMINNEFDTEGVLFDDELLKLAAPLACPEFGSFIGWKTAKGMILKLLIPEDARRSSAFGRKCRCDRAVCLEIQQPTGEPANLNEITSDYNPNFYYRVGELVSVDNFDEDRIHECAPGIHFFITRQEAVEYI